MLRLIPLVLAVCLAFPAAAQDNSETVPGAIPVTAKNLEEAGHPHLPGLLRWMIHPQKRGMFLNLPVIDTDPNRGTTFGVMPIWVITEKSGERVEQIHAPSLTYNSDFSFIPTYRYYYYPAADQSLVLRASASVLAEREVFGYYQNRRFLGRDIDFSLNMQYNVDGSYRFFGLGPASLKSNESDYTEDIIQYDVAAGVPVKPGSHWLVYATDHMAGQKLYAGKVDTLPGVTEKFPNATAAFRRQVNEPRAILQYDTRDNAMTTSQGAYLQAYAGASVSGMASQYDYTRYGIDGRYFYKWPRKGQVTAAQFKYDQLLGDAPFWLLSRMGGKYSLRSYGAGRYIDRGAAALSLEQRISVYQTKMAGVTTEIEVAPFAGLGSVFDHPGTLARRYMRPVVGGAVRAVARPQVVGSIDVGVGQEGAAVFMDINYSF